MNNVTMVGHVCKIGNITQAKTGSSFVKATIAVRKYKSNEYDYWDLLFWDDRANYFLNNCIKGTKIAVNGRIQQREYRSKDGIRVKTLDLNVSEFELLAQKKKETDTPKGEIEVDDPENVDTFEIDESDLPF